MTMRFHKYAGVITVLFALLFCCVLFSVLTVDAFAATSGTSGTCSWVIDDDGVLTISPKNGVSGQLESYTGGKGPWYSYRTSIKKVIVEPGVKAGAGCYRLFFDLTNCTEMDISNLDTSDVTYMDAMFGGCSKITSLDLSSFDTSKVKNMSNMFLNCSGLTSLNVSSFDTDNVYDMRQMFYNCSGLTSLNISSFNTGKVSDMHGMFQACSGLTSLDLSSFDTSKVTNMSKMFCGCSGLTSLDVSGFDTSNVTTMSEIFSGCSGLTSLDVSSFNTGNVTSMSSMFSGCSNLTNLDVSEFDTSSARSMGRMFQNCSKLINLDVSGFDTSNVTDMSQMFTECSGLTALDVSWFDTRNVTKMNFMFHNCSGLTSLDVSGFDTSNVTDMQSMFYGCRGLTSIDLSSFNTGKVTNMSMMFRYCENLSFLDVSGWNTANIGNMANAFEGCSNLSTIALGENFNFKGNNITRTTLQGILPTPPSSTTSSKWIRDDEAVGPYTATELRNQYGDNAETWAGTWVWQVKDTVATVRFDANGGMTSAQPVTMTNSVAPVVVPDETTTSRYNYILTSWNTAADGSGTSYAPGSEANVAVLGKTVTIYAQWRIDTRVNYTVKHLQQKADNEGEYVLVDTETFKEEPGTEVTPAVKDYPGFLAPAVVTITLSDTEDNIVEYRYNRTHYRVSFDGNGSTSGRMDEQPMVGGISSPLTANTYSKKGSLFTGWSTEADGSGTGYTNAQEVANIGNDGDIVTLYAQWMTNDNAITPTEGVVYVTAKAGETIVIPDLPAGTKYTIEEVDNPDGWTLDGIIGENGTITPNTRSSATANNVYHANGSVSIVAHKQLVGDTIYTGQFTFVLKDANGEVIDTKTNGSVDTAEEVAGPNDDAVVNPWYGTAPVRFDEIEYTEPGTYTYTVSEVVGADTTVDYDDTTKNVTVVVTDNGNGTLNAAVSFENDDALFTNTVNPGELKVSKTTVNGTSVNEDMDFSFLLTVKDASGNVQNETYQGSKNGSPVDVTAGEAFLLKANEEISIQIPHGSTYSIEELPSEGWELTSVVNNSGTITGGDEISASFENTYSAVGQATIAGTKTFDEEIPEETFVFELLDNNGTVLQRTYANTDGSISFSPIDYTLDDNGKTFSYTVREVAGGNPDIIYDEHVEEVTVAVEDAGNGTLNTEVTYDADGMVFENETMNCTLTISKTVAGNLGDKSKLFSFTITASRNEQPLEGTYGDLEFANGTAEFSLGHGDSVTVEGLGVGTEYSITEDAEGYKSKATNASGSIERGDNEASFTNTLNAAVPTDIKIFTGTGIVLAVIGLGALVTLAVKKKKAKATE